MPESNRIPPAKRFSYFFPADNTSKQVDPELVENLALIQQNFQASGGPAYQIRKEGHTQNPPQIPAPPPSTRGAHTYRMATPAPSATNESRKVAESSRVEPVTTSLDSRPKDKSIALAQECAHLLQRKIVIVNHPEANGGLLKVTSDNVNTDLEPIKIFYNQKKGCYEGYENGGSKTVLGKSGSGSIQEAILVSSSPTTITYEGLMAALYTARLANVIGTPIGIPINDSLEHVYRPKKKSDKNPITIVCKDKYSFSGVFNGQIAPTQEEPMFDSIARAVIIAQRGDNPAVTASEIEELRREACRTIQEPWRQLWKSTVKVTHQVSSTPAISSTPAHGSNAKQNAKQNVQQEADDKTGSMVTQPESSKKRKSAEENHTATVPPALTGHAAPTKHEGSNTTTADPKWPTHIPLWVNHYHQVLSLFHDETDNPLVGSPEETYNLIRVMASRPQDPKLLAAPLKNFRRLQAETLKLSSVTFDDIAFGPLFESNDLHTYPLEPVGANFPRSKIDIIERLHRKVRFLEPASHDLSNSGKPSPDSSLKHKKSPKDASLPKLRVKHRPIGR